MAAEQCGAGYEPKPVWHGETKPICPDPNRIPGYIRPGTVETDSRGSKIIGGSRGIDINI